MDLKKNTPPRLSERGAVEQSQSHRSLGYNAPQLLNGAEAGALLGVSARTLRRLANAGKAPGPLKLGALIRWRRDDIERWVDAGCPRVGKGGVQ